MSIEEEILVIENMVKDIEEYVQKGIWNSDINIRVASEITDADVILDQLMTGHSMKIDILSEEQIQLVSNLLERLHQSKDKLPSPPWV